MALARALVVQMCQSSLSGASAVVLQNCCIWSMRCQALTFFLRPLSRKTCERLAMIHCCLTFDIRSVSLSENPSVAGSGWYLKFRRFNRGARASISASGVGQIDRVSACSTGADCTSRFLKTSWAAEFRISLGWASRLWSNKVPAEKLASLRTRAQKP